MFLGLVGKRWCEANLKIRHTWNKFVENKDIISKSNHIRIVWENKRIERHTCMRMVNICSWWWCFFFGKILSVLIHTHINSVFVRCAIWLNFLFACEQKKWNSKATWAQYTFRCVQGRASKLFYDAEKKGKTVCVSFPIFHFRRKFDIKWSNIFPIWCTMFSSE